MAAPQYVTAGETECALFEHGFEPGGAVPPMGDATFSGRLLDTNDFVKGTVTPIVGATVSLLHTAISDTTDIDGYFTLTQVDSTVAVIDMDPSTGLPGPGGVSYAGFRERIVIVPCIDNVIDRPFFLPRIDESSLTTVDPDNETVVTNANIGVSITVPPHTAMMDGEEFTGQLSISEVPEGLAPAAMPENLQPGLLVTIQPVGVTFNTPVPITFPNTDSLPANGVMDIWSLDPEAGIFVAVGRGEVSADGTSVQTVVGGVRAADWHFALQAAVRFLQEVPLLGVVAPFLLQEIDGTSEVGVRDGSLRMFHELPAIKSLDTDVAPTFVYDSRQAHPRPVVANVVQLPRTSFVPVIPNQLSARLRVDFGLAGSEIFTTTAGLSPQANEQLVQSLQFDAAGLSTGVHFYELTVTSHFAESSVGAAAAGFLMVDNRGASPFGAGWSLAELDRLVTNSDDVILLIQGDGAVVPFLESREFLFFRNPEFAVDCCNEAIIAADFNNDGYPDLLNLGGVDGGVVRLNDQEGQFVQSDLLGLGTDSGHTAVTGLINADLHVDIAVSSNAFASSRVTVFVGDGTGIFTRLDDHPTGSLPRDLVLGDFNEDGNLDIVTANEFGGTISFLAGDGNGGFAAAIEFDARGVATQGPSTIGAADLDGNGTLDVAVSGQSAEMAILYGDGTGMFAEPVSYNTNGVSRSLLIDDFNGDNNPDIAVTSYAGGTGGVEVFLGNGLSGFGVPIRSSAGVAPLSLKSADLNQDGKPDLAVLNEGSETVTILLGLGTGSFLQGKTIDFLDFDATDVDPLAIADFNQDLFPDLAILDDGVGVLDEIHIIDNISVDGEEFLAPPHVFSRLFRNEDGTFRHVFKDGVTVNFNASGLQTSRVDRFNNQIGYEYDGSGRLSTITYPTGQAFEFDYLAGSVVITDPAGRQTSLVVDGLGDLVRIDMPDGRQNFYSYGAEHNLEMFTSAGGHVYQYQYDLNGMIEEVNAPNGEMRMFEPGLAMGLPEMPGQGTSGNPLPFLEAQDVIDRFTDGLGRSTEWTTTRLGDATSRRNALNQTVLLERDERHLVTGIRLATFDRMEFSYDDRGNLLTATDATNGTHTFQYNEHNLPTLYISPIGDQIAMTYTPQGVLETYNDGAVSVTNTYNAMGLLETQSDGDNNAISYEYDVHGNLEMMTDAGGHVVEFTRNAAGNIITSTNDAGQSASYTYDDGNRLLTLTNEANETVSYTHDSQGNLETVTGPDGLLFTYGYNQVRQLTSITDALNRETTYGYDVVRNLTSASNPNGTSITYQYDALNRLSDVIASTGEVMSYEYNTLGKLVRMEDNDSLIEAQHDDMGRTTQITLNGDSTHTAQPANVSFSLTYNDAGQLTNLVQVDGTPITYVYDAAGLLSGLSTPDIDHQFLVDNASRFTAVTTQIAGGVASGFLYTFTPNDQLDLLEVDINGATAYSYDITLDDIGRRTGITDNAGTRSYSYDSVGRLLSASHPDMANEAYSYDASGNRLTSAHTPGSATFDFANQIDADGAFEYSFDANGNLVLKTDLVSGEEFHYSYNAFDQLTSVEHQDDLGMTLGLTEFAYDAAGRRIMKTVNGTVTKFVHHQERVVATYDGTDTLLATFLHGPQPDMPLSMETLGEQFVFHRDPIGSVIAISDQFGSIQNQYGYDSFGRIISQSETLDNPFGFTGALQDDETGLVYLRKRYYDPFSGRFIQADQRNFLAGINTYTYALNNPLSFTDPTGEAAWGAVAGATLNLLGQAAEGRSGSKDTKDLEWKSFAFDTALGAATCGMGSGMKWATKLPKTQLQVLPNRVRILDNSARVKNIERFNDAFNLVVGFTSSAFSAEFKPGEKPLSDADFMRNVLIGGVGGFASGKFASPFQTRAGDNTLTSTVADKSADYLLGTAAKKLWTEFDQ